MRAFEGPSLGTESAVGFALRTEEQADKENKMGQI
jgi:hypothetical protein